MKPGQIEHLIPPSSPLPLVEAASPQGQPYFVLNGGFSLILSLVALTKPENPLYCDPKMETVTPELKG